MPATPRPSPLAPTLLALTALGGCVPVGITGQVGYAHVRVGGEIALDDGGGSPSQNEQSVESAFGLGDWQGSPYLRAQVDAGGPVLTTSLFRLREEGRGQLADSFGGLPSGTTVESSLDLGVAKISAAYDFDLGLVKLAPGVLFDVFALDFSARELTLGSREEIDEIVFVPMPFVRAEAGVGPFTAVGEIGYLEVSDLGDNEGRFLDAEVMVEWHPLPLGHFFAGYRYIDVDGSGKTGDESFSTDLQIQGWTLGGGIRF
ncbi:MAG: hypothetical protein KAI24_12220 [Planctomycetes bacterium]|nr:hypothetical protein [Planctomycetota bacterium]